MFIALIYGDISDSTSGSSVELSASEIDFIQNERIDPRLFVISEPAKKLYAYNTVILLTKIKPVNIGGVKVSNATLHNEDEINRKDIRIGDTVKIERAGDVIPHVILVDLKKRPMGLKKFIFPTKCPSCGSDVVKEYNKQTKKYDAVKRCTSEGYDCERIAIEKIKHFISKDALNIDGLGKRVVEKFWEQKIIRLPQDIFNLNYEMISNLEGWGKLSVSNLKYSIDSKRSISLDKFIYSLGIRHIGFENAKLLAKHLKSSDNFFKLSKDKNMTELSNIDGIGETQIKSIKNFFLNSVNLEVLLELKKIVKIQNVFSINQTGVLKNKTFMLTGKLQGISRAEAKSIIAQNSGKIINNVNKKLDYLIVGEKPTKRKIEAAKELNIKILKQSEWIKLLNKSS